MSRLTGWLQCCASFRVVLLFRCFVVSVPIGYNALPFDHNVILVLHEVIIIILLWREK